MSNGNRKLTYTLLHLVPFVILYILSETVFSGLYLFKWTARNWYLEPSPAFPYCANKKETRKVSFFGLKAVESTVPLDPSLHLEAEPIPGPRRMGLEQGQLYAAIWRLRLEQQWLQGY